MASHYDPAKKCRVGTMDEDQFYSEAGKSSGAYFSTLINGWGKGVGRSSGARVVWDYEAQPGVFLNIH